MGSKDVGMAEADTRQRGSKPLWWHMRCCPFCACSGRLGTVGGGQAALPWACWQECPGPQGPEGAESCPFPTCCALAACPSARQVHPPGEQQLLPWLAFPTWKHRRREVIQSHPVSQRLSWEQSKSLLLRPLTQSASLGKLGAFRGTLPASAVSEESGLQT